MTPSLLITAFGGAMLAYVCFFEPRKKIAHHNSLHAAIASLMVVTIGALMALWYVSGSALVVSLLVAGGAFLVVFAVYYVKHEMPKWQSPHH